MNPPINHILLFSIGVMLMMVTAVNCKLVRRNLSDFKKWYLSTDYMNSIAAILAGLGVVLVNWGMF